MGLLPGKKGKTDEEKLQEQRVQQDSFQVNQVEGRMMAKNQEENQNTKNQLLDPEEDKAKLKKLLLNKEIVKVPNLLYFCSNCGQAYKEKPEKCRADVGNEKCGNKSFQEEQEGTRIEYVDVSDDELLNSNGFHKIVWSEIEPAISSTVAGGYLKSQEVSKLNYSTLSNITMQLALYPWKYGVDNPSDMQQIGDIIRPLLVAHTSKARGGRGLESTERTTMQKITQAITPGDEDDEQSIF